MNLNKVLLIGRLTQDPQLRSTNSGQQVATLSLATNRTWTDKSGARQEATEYHTVVVWGRQAEIANQFLKKGGMVLIEGRLQTRSWQDNQGQARKTTEVIAERIQLGPRPAGAGQGYGAPKRPTGSANAGVDAAPKEEIPTIEMGGEGESDESDGAQAAKPEDLPF